MVKKKKSNQRMGEDMKKHFTEGKSAYEKTCDIPRHQGNEN